jgi:hypothetical protein
LKAAAKVAPYQNWEIVRQGHQKAVAFWVNRVAVVASRTATHRNFLDCCKTGRALTPLAIFKRNRPLPARVTLREARHLVLASSTSFALCHRAWDSIWTLDWLFARTTVVAETIDASKSWHTIDAA